MAYFLMHRHTQQPHILHSWQASKNIMKYSAGVCDSTCLSYFSLLCADLSEPQDELLPVYMLVSVLFLCGIYCKCEFVCAFFWLACFSHIAFLLFYG